MANAMIISARHVVRINGRWYRLLRLSCGHTKVRPSYATPRACVGSFINCGCHLSAPRFIDADESHQEARS